MLLFIKMVSTGFGKRERKRALSPHFPFLFPMKQLVRSFSHSPPFLLALKGGKKLGERRGRSAVASAAFTTPATTPSSSRRPSQSATRTRTTKSFDSSSSFIGLTGGEIVHEMMLRQQVKVVFGYPGGAILPVYDAIYHSPYFDFILPRHEQGAGHMAEG
jgi:hypothetical protein